MTFAQIRAYLDKYALNILESRFSIKLLRPCYAMAASTLPCHSNGSDFDPVMPTSTLP